MTDLDQLADEAIALRWDYIRAADTLPDSIRDAHRANRLANWAWNHPALDALAVRRETALGLLAEQGITPDQGTTVSLGTVHIHAQQHAGPLRHVYSLTREVGQLPEGLAWLSTSEGTAGRYVVVSDTWQPGSRFEGRTLHDALTLLAQAIDRSERIQAAARRGDVQ